MRKYFSIVLLAIIVLSSCEEDKIIFNGDQTLVAFSATTIDLPIEIDATGSVNVNVDVTTQSESERVFDVNIVQEETTAESASYSFGSITIPANSFNGVFTINGVDNNVTTNAKTLVLQIAEGGNFVTSGQNLTVNIFEVCPVEETLFTGMYLIEEITPFLPGSGPALNSGNVVEVVADGLSRSFNTPNFPNFCSTPIPFSFSLICNEFVVDLQNTNCSCNSGTDYFGPSTSGHATYNVSDDSSFEIVFSNDVQNDCGSGPIQTTYRFTRQ